MDPNDPDIEKRLRSALRGDGDSSEPSGDAWDRLEKRLRREPWRKAGFTGLVLAVIAALAFVVVPRLDVKQGTTAIPAGPDASANPTPTADGTSSPAADPFFAAFYPATTLEDARRLQDSVDNGHQPLILDPAEVARQFARDYIGWLKVELGQVSKEGSAAAGWRAKVELRPYIGEGNPPNHLGTKHTVEMIGLAGAENPTWFVTAIRSDNLVLEGLKGGPADKTPGPFQITGKGVAFEGTILTDIRDDSGATLFPRPGKQEGFTQGGSMELAPFEASIPVEGAKTPAGVLILRASSGLDGPAPDWTVVRVNLMDKPIQP